MQVVSLGEKSADEITERLLKALPKGYALYHETEAAKIIKGVRGRYFHFRHPDKGDFISFNIGAGGKPYRIVLGSFIDPQSKIRTVLEALPDRPFRKAQLVHILPQSIVENRQPIKAAIDILEKEGYVKKIATKGTSEDYVRTEKPIPSISQPKVVG
ncbi:MAG: hypothetical protein HY619_05490 [Thaumarchaeota archaeon]|nr:hypothetical protein [Nitrososphaerota archaeon]